MPYFYKIQNRVFKSDIELFLPRSEPVDDPNFIIEFSPTPLKISPSDKDPKYKKNSIFFSLNNIDFEIKNKKKIICYCENLDKKLLQKSLLGLPFGFLMYQIGYFVLHASSIEYKNKGFIFVGPSSSGKSSIVSTLINKGFNFLSDDLVIINDAFKIERFIEKIDVPNDIYEMNKYKNSFREFDLNDKRNRKSIIFNQSSQKKVCSIEKIYFLDWGSINKIEKTNFKYNFKNIFVNSFRSLDEKNLAAKENDLDKISKLSNKINCYKFTRPKNIDLFYESINSLINHIKK